MVVDAVNKKKVKGKDFLEVMGMIQSDERPLTLSFKSHTGRSVTQVFNDPGPLGIRLVDRLKLLNDEQHDLSIELMASPRSSPERQKLRQQMNEMDRWVEQASHHRNQRQQELWKP